MIYYTKETCIYCGMTNGIDLGELKDFTVENIWGYKCCGCGNLVQMQDHDGSNIQNGCKIWEY